MEHTVTVLYRGKLAQYFLEESRDGTYEAVLHRYFGKRQNSPPKQVTFKAEGRHCEGNTEERDLLDDLFYALPANERKRNGPPM